jgi:hypothetical protein
MIEGCTGEEAENVDVEHVILADEASPYPECVLDDRFRVLDPVLQRANISARWTYSVPLSFRGTLSRTW